MSDQFDVALVFCATMYIRIIEQAYCGHRPRGTRSQAAPAKMAKERHKTTAKRLIMTSKRCKTNYEDAQTDYKETQKDHKEMKTDQFVVSFFSPFHLCVLLP